MDTIAAEPKTQRKFRLINPRSALSTITIPNVIQAMTFSRKALFMPLNLAICASLVPNDWNVEIIDECALETPHLPKADCELVGIGAMTTQSTRAYELADAYRKLGVKVILGGIHPSALPEEASQHADVVVIGEAEATLPVIFNDYQNLQLKNIYNWRDYPPAPIATPRKDLLSPKDYLVFNPIQTTRGCPHNCAFCTTSAIFGRRFRQRNIDDIVEEIRSAKENYGSKFFIFSDDNFAGNRKWAIELCHKLIPLKIKWASQCEIMISESDELLSVMKASGCIGLILGLESVSPSTLQDAGKKFVSAETYAWRIKKINSYNISLWGAFIFGFDHDTWQTCRDTCRFAQQVNLSMACFPILTPYPGTEMFRRYESQGRILTKDWTKYNGSTVVFQPEHFSIQELRHAQLSAFHEFYHPCSAFKRLKLLPFKKYAWIANLASYFGLWFYFNHKNRILPRFADFQNPFADAWNYHENLK
jgi:radical SAM superfamily enzyme YgiQ (UPF0313 family)